MMKKYTVKIIVTEENGQLKSNIIWDEKENDSSLIIFTNTYYDEILEDNFMISGTITWDHGKNQKINNQILLLLMFMRMID